MEMEAGCSTDQKEADHRQQHGGPPIKLGLYNNMHFGRKEKASTPSDFDSYRWGMCVSVCQVCATGTTGPEFSQLFQMDNKDSQGGDNEWVSIRL